MEEKSQYAIIKAGGRQVRVTAGQKILVDKLEGEKGQAVTIDAVLLIGDGNGAPRIGTPYIEGASVQGKILRTQKAKKVIAFKRQPKKGWKTKKGHRQQHTELLIERINA